MSRDVFQPGPVGLPLASARRWTSGWPGDILRRCLCQYGSTLRWLGQYDRSLAALDLTFITGAGSARL